MKPLLLGLERSSVPIWRIENSSVTSGSTTPASRCRSSSASSSPSCFSIEASLAMFARLREGARFLDELEQRLWDDEDFVYAGSTVDAVDHREIEKIFVDAPAAPGRYHARDLSAKLSWIADDEQDDSLRVRFSFGHEATRDWLTPGPRTEWSDRFAERVFPECAVITESTPLRAVLDACLDRSWRLSERIVYANTPGGGAMFHHDADPGQRGVVFAQLAGHTVWLALPRAELVDRLAETSAGLGDADSIGAALDGEPDPRLWDALNANPTLTAQLASTGRLLVLTPGDALLLPSHSAECCAWHSVFGVGDARSLAHSYGIFDHA